VTPCAICTVHVETRSVGFLVEPQNHCRRFVSVLASKPLRWFVSSLASKSPRRFSLIGLRTGGDGFLSVRPQNWWLQVSWFVPQNRQLRFSELCLKITMTVSWLGLKTKRVMICRLRHKIDGRMNMAWGTRQD
jgi:hypothetical protein